MKNVLIVTSPLTVGGFDIIATGLQLNMNKEKYDFTYYIKGEEIGPLEEVVLKSGAKVIHSPNSVKGYYGQYKYLKKVMTEGGYDIVHSHLMFFSGIVMKAAKECGIKTRIPHSHMTNPCMEDRILPVRIIAKLYSIVMKKWLNKYGTDLIACGPEAGYYLYGKRNFESKGILLNNAIDFNKFVFDKKDRENIRAEFNIDNDTLILGHVGRLNYVKNHTFLIKVFYETQKINPNSKLLIVGEGEDRKSIESQAYKLNIQDKVIVTGIRNDVSKMLSAMDVFVFPSLYEGVPVTLVEAQATKLPCLVSDRVTKYVKKNANIKYFSLNKAPAEWAKSVLYMAKMDRADISLDNLKENYDIKKIVTQLEKIYDN